MLVTRVPGDLRWADGSIALRVPGEHERLVASIGDVGQLDLFENDRVIPIHLDNINPLPGPPVAWEALDAIVLDRDTMARITTGQRSALLAAGVMLVVPGEIRPDDRWPWKRRGTHWVLAYLPAGPMDQLINPEAFSPTYAWLPGWPPAVRAQVGAAAVLLFLAIVAVSMFKNNRAVIGLVVLTLGSTVATLIWQRSLGSMARAGGDIIVQHSTNVISIIQRDTWVFERARQTDQQIVPWVGSTHPVFGSANSFDESAMSIHITATNADDEACTFQFYLNRGKTIAFLRREVQPQSLPVTDPTHDSPMNELAKAMYLNIGDHIAGQTHGELDRWAGVVIKQKSER